jgi:hypothetical protein
MKNILNKLIILSHYFYDMPFVVSGYLYFYLYDNLEKENFDTLKINLKNALIINANGEYT